MAANQSVSSSASGPIAPLTSCGQIVLKHWSRIIKQWPVDKVRPEHVHFQKIMQSRLNKLTSPTAAAAADAKSNDASVKAPQPWDNQNELRQINALYALLENRFEKEDPIPARVRHPQSNPAHYDDLVRELDEAPNRSWVTSLWNRIRGSVRIK